MFPSASNQNKSRILNRTRKDNRQLPQNNHQLPLRVKKKKRPLNLKPKVVTEMIELPQTDHQLLSRKPAKKLSNTKTTREKKKRKKKKKKKKKKKRKKKKKKRKKKKKKRNVRSLQMNHLLSLKKHLRKLKNTETQWVRMMRARTSQLNQSSKTT